MMTPPLAPILERKWPTRPASGICVDGARRCPGLCCNTSCSSSSPRSPGHTARLPRRRITNDSDFSARLRSAPPPSSAAAANVANLHARSACQPARSARRAFSQFSTPPASQDSAFSDKKAVGQVAGLYPSCVLSPAFEVVLSRIPTAQGSSASITQRTRTPFLRSNTLQQKPRNMN